MKKELNGVSMKQIAEHANISTATVSRVLRTPHQVKGSSREAVFQSMRDLGIDPELIPVGKDASASATAPIILILSRLSDDNLTARREIQKVYEVINRNDYLGVCIDPSILPEPLKKNILIFIQENNVKGVLSILRLEESLINAIAALVPIVQMGDVSMASHTNIVTFDYYAAACKTVKHLISHGCKNIACILADTNMSDSSARKRQGYLTALGDAGMEPNPSYITEVPKVDFNAAYSVVSTLLKREPIPDAIFCGTDVFAVAALATCQQNGIRVPEDIMITGFDDSIVASMTTPKITTVRCSDLGYISTEILFDCILHPSSKVEKILLEPEMIIRGSTR